jgi:hypothetical protein
MHPKAIQGVKTGRITSPSRLIFQIELCSRVRQLRFAGLTQKSSFQIRTLPNSKFA